ncbi:MAG: 4-(cytidine 5'-diphospho)-2-C-methyl-D-erythritol kinase [Candidatus Omnitrophota bacterium]
MRSLVVSSYAKLNLYLKVVGRRRDGYHNLVTLFHRISLKDTLHLERKSEGFSLRCSSPALSSGEDNIITRAYRLLKRRYPRLGGVSVSLSKKIPLGAGLGGGSSNAAAFLLGMKKLYRLRLSLQELLKMGRTLGADVPFFILNCRQASAEGIGEKLLRRPIRRPLWFVLILSAKGLATREVYGRLLRRRPQPSLTKIRHAVKLICSFLEGSGKSSLGLWLCNDLEQPAFCLRPSLRKLLDRFHKLGVPTARMSGSGPTLFALLSNRQDAIRLARQLNGDGVGRSGRARTAYRVVVCHSV